MSRNTIRKLLEATAIAIIVLIGVNKSLAQNKVTVMVSATVVARISQSLVYQESRINVTEPDIDKGFVEIPSGTILQVETNDKKGYFLHFEGGNEFIKEVWVMEKRRTTVLSPKGGLIHQPYSGSKTEIKDLSFRFYLRDDTSPGTYPWPFKVTASLL